MQIDHDLHGRVGPPRCQECNAPLCTDDVAYSGGVDTSIALCNDCLQLMISEQDIRSFL